MPAWAVVAAVMVSFAGEPDELVRVLDGEALQQELVDEREDGGVRADAERQREDRYRGEERRLQERAERVAEVLQDSGHARFILPFWKKVTLKEPWELAK